MGVNRVIPAALGYIVLTFIIAAGWHLVLFKPVYDELAIFTRKDPIIPLGVLSIVLQSMVFAHLYPRYLRGERPALEGLKFGVVMGVFLGSYAVLADGAKFHVSSLPTWLSLESVYYLVQFSIVGIAFGLIYGKQHKIS
jgi:hypothetical protein